MFRLLRAMKLLLLPLVLLLTSGYLLTFTAQIPHQLQLFAQWSPVMVMSVMFFLSAFFNQSRLLFTSLIGVLVWAYLSLNLHNVSLNQLVMLFVSLNVLLVVFYRERGSFNRVGLIRLSIIIAQSLILVFLYNLKDKVFLGWIDWPSLMLFDGVIGLPSLAGLILCLSIMFFKLFKSGEMVDGYLLVTVAFSSYLLIVQPEQQIKLSLYCALNQLLLLIALFKHSLTMAYMDELTGLPGRRALNERMVQLGKNYTAAMLDIDFFKKFNDTYGHDVGDQVLRLVASRIGQVQGGTAYRYGGEEFCILFPHTDINKAFESLEKVRISVENSSLTLRSNQRSKDDKKGRSQRGQGGKGQSVSVTISGGVAVALTRECTLKSADKALYKAKDAGRNQICLA